MRLLLSAAGLLLLVLLALLPGCPWGPSASFFLALAFLLLLALLVLVLLAGRPPRLGGALAAEGKAVLITGCDKGIGHALARHLHSKGLTVFAGCLFKDRGGEGARALGSLGSERLRVLQLDVCRQEEVDRALSLVQESLEDPQQGEPPPPGVPGPGPSLPPPQSPPCKAQPPLSLPPWLWGLVNNAGVASFGEVEFTSLDRYREVAEVNLWGAIRVTKAFLPLVRRARGRVVNLTSALGRVGSPLRSSYCVSKFGLEAFTDCLRQEMRPWGVAVGAVEPSNFIAATGIFTEEGVEAAAREMWGRAGQGVRDDYGEASFRRQVGRMKAFVRSGLSDLGPVLDDITDALLARLPYARYNPMEPRWWLRLQAVTHLPSLLTDWLYAN